MAKNKKPNKKATKEEIAKITAFLKDVLKDVSYSVREVWADSELFDQWEIYFSFPIISFFSGNLIEIHETSLEVMTVEKNKMKHPVVLMVAEAIKTRTKTQPILDNPKNMGR